jgi:integrase
MECWVRRRVFGKQMLTCGCGCDQEFRFRRDRKSINGLYFLNSKHYGAYLREQHLIQSCGGPLLPTVREFLSGFAILHYKEQYTLTHCIFPFFEFLQLEGITSLEDVTPKTVTAYLAWGQKTGRRKVANSPSFLSTFFKWSIASGYRNAGNPVVPLIHRLRREWRMPRPLENDELKFTWDLLQERGNARLRLAAAIAEEAGLRLGEICRLRLQDVDLMRQRLFVRLPNKGNRERYAFFSEKTKRYYDEWMAERDQHCSNDHLLHNSRGGPCRVQILGNEFSRTLCKTHHGKKLHETGWEKWSTHRFRHTMASRLVSAGADAATVMAAGGWKTYEAMCGYARVDEDVARRGYEDAMQRARQQQEQVPRKKALSLSEFLELKHKKA